LVDLFPEELRRGGNVGEALLSSGCAVLDGDPPDEPRIGEAAKDSGVVVLSLPDHVMLKDVRISLTAISPEVLWTVAWVNPAVTRAHTADTVDDAIEKGKGIFADDKGVGRIEIDAEPGRSNLVYNPEESLSRLGELRVGP
jgi:hypothetical protein